MKNGVEGMSTPMDSTKAHFLSGPLSLPSRSLTLPTFIRAFYATVVSKAWRIFGGTALIHTVPDIGLMGLDPSDMLGSKLFFFGSWEPETGDFVRRNAILGKNSVAIDIGAKIGYFTLMFSQLVGSDGMVYSIEPSPFIREKLEQNISLNRLTNVKVIPFGTSNRTEARKFNLNSDRNLGESHFAQVCAPDEDKAGSIQLRRLSKIISVAEMAKTAPACGINIGAA